MNIDVYDGMGEISHSGEGAVISQSATGNPDWDLVVVQFTSGHKVEGYIPKEKVSQQ